MKFTNKQHAPITLLAVALVLTVIQLLSTGVNGETDSITHYQIARYAFKYPAFFLDHWGKPLFTILSSSFAQMGYLGATIFNLICGLLSGWFAYLISKKLGYKHAWAAIVFTVFAPGYLFIMYSSLTEILFSLVLITAIYLFISKRFIWAAIVISMIPYSRAEGMMYIFLFFAVLFWMKQYKALPFLLTGFVLFSLAGWPHYHDLLWFFTKMPYSNSGSGLYGSGSFWYYFSNFDKILEYPLLILSVTGLIYILLNIKTVFKNSRDIEYVTLYFLIVPAFFGFLLAQSFLWWKGLMGVLGSARFIACVLPLSAIVATTGFEWIMEKAKAIKFGQIVLGLYVLMLVVSKPFTNGTVPIKTGINFAVMEKLTIWLKNSPFGSHKAFYSDPMFPFYMDMDPFDTKTCFKIYDYQNTDPASLLKPGELLIWDAQFTGYEGHLPFDSLMKNNNLRLLNIFTPMESFNIIGGAKYKLAVFMKAPRDTTATRFKQFYLNDFESGIPEPQSKFVNTEYHTSGKQAIMLTPDNIYSPSVEGKLKSLPGYSNISLRASVNILNPSPSENGQIILTLSIDNPEHKVFRYLVACDNETKYKPGEWFQITLTDMIDRMTPLDGNYKVYVWYTGKSRIFVDDLKLEYMPVGTE